MSFTDLGLRAELMKALADKGYEIPTPIQAAAIPTVLTGEDVLAAAQTGTGKTAGFVLPLLQRLMEAAPTRAPRAAKPGWAQSSTPRRPVRALILTPTRELAAQVEESVRTYGKHLPLTSTVVFGGVGMQPQVHRLRAGVDILVATPGRLLDHVGQRTLDLSHVEIFVLDEADRMLDMGFIRDIKRILPLLPPKRQNLLFSATFSDEIKTLAGELLNAPRHIEVARQNEESPLVTQSVSMVPKDHKRDVLSRFLSEQNLSQVLVFTRTKHGADRLAKQLTQDGVEAGAIHGNRSQSQRTQVLADFKSGKVRVLVATDIAARGLDIAQLPHVINYELPNVPEDYVHRIGRTGRAGHPGAAWSLVASDERPYLNSIEKLIGKRLERRASGLSALDAQTIEEPEPLSIPASRGNVRNFPNAPSRPGRSFEPRGPERGPRSGTRRDDGPRVEWPARENARPPRIASTPRHRSRPTAPRSES